MHTYILFTDKTCWRGCSMTLRRRFLGTLNVWTGSDCGVSEAWEPCVDSSHRSSDMTLLLRSSCEKETAVCSEASASVSSRGIFDLRRVWNALLAFATASWNGMESRRMVTADRMSLRAGKLTSLFWLAKSRIFQEVCKLSSVRGTSWVWNNLSQSSEQVIFLLARKC